MLQVSPMYFYAPCETQASILVNVYQLSTLIGRGQMGIAIV